MTKRQITCLGWAMAALAMGLGTAAPAGAEDHAASRAGSIHIVHPGESIQKAVDAARPGDTVLILPGTYHESVLITASDLTLEGSGETTVIKPTTARAGNACAKAGNGICVLGTADRRVDDVHIRSLTVSDFPKNGIWASRTDRLSVRGVTAERNGQWGIAQERSTRGDFQANSVRKSGDAGLFVANVVDHEGGATDTRGATFRDNHLTGNRIGVTLRRVRNLTLEHNIITGNCAGAFVVGDESLPRAGDLTVSHNIVARNNKHCPATARLPYLQGSGIVLTGAEDTLVTRNVVRDNVGASPLSGGIVLFPSQVKAANNRNVISYNVVLDNKPADLADRDTTGTDNRFVGGRCRVSEPAGLC